MAKYIPTILDALEKVMNREFYITEKDLRNLPTEDLKAEYIELQAVNEKNSQAFRQHDQSIRARLESIDPGQHPKGFFDNFSINDQDAFSLLEFLATKAGIEPTFFSARTQGIYRQVGGQEPAYLGFYNELLEQMMLRDPDLKKYISSDTYFSTFKLYRISEKGKASVMENPQRFIGDHPLVFHNLPNRNPQFGEISKKTVASRPEPVATVKPSPSGVNPSCSQRISGFLKRIIRAGL